MVLVFLIEVLPKGVQQFLAGYVPSKSINHIRDVVGIMHRTSAGIFVEKKHALSSGEELAASKTGRGKDIMSILRT
jgi:hypothetical protein